MCTPAPIQRKPFPKGNWTPRGLEVLATAKQLATPAGTITPQHLLLASEAGESVAAQVLRHLGISPSALLGHSLLTSLAPDAELYDEDFDAMLSRDLQRLAVDEAKRMETSYLGTEHLLLVLARLGVSGVDLPYERIREAIIAVKYAP